MENKRKESTEVNVSFWVKRSCKTYLSFLFGSDVILEQIIMSARPGKCQSDGIFFNSID